MERVEDLDGKRRARESLGAAQEESLYQFRSSFRQPFQGESINGDLVSPCILS